MTTAKEYVQAYSHHIRNVLSGKGRKDLVKDQNPNEGPNGTIIVLLLKP